MRQTMRRPPRSPGPLKRISLFRLAVTAAILSTAVLAFALQAGVFRFLFRGALVIGAVVLIASYLFERWLKWRARRGRPMPWPADRRQGDR